MYALSCRYNWTIISGASSLDPNVVLGLFLYDDKTPPAYKEIDIEFARWGATPAQDGSNAQWVIQPYNNSDHLQVGFAFWTSVVAFKSKTYPSPIKSSGFGSFEVSLRWL